MAQIGTIKVQTDSGIVDVPVFDIGDSGGSTVEALRVQTDSGIGFVPLVDPIDAASPQEAIRVQTDSGIKAVTDSVSAIPASVLTQDLVAWYRFEDGDARDYASNNEFPDVTWGDSTAYDGTVNGATFQSGGGVTDFETGANSGAFDFSTSDYIQVTSGLGSGFSSGFSVCFYVNFDSFIGTTFSMAYDSGTDSNTVFRVEVDNDVTDGLDFGINDGDGDIGKTEAYSQSLNTNQWYFVACTYGSGTNKIYIDGTEQGSNNHGGTPIDGPEDNFWINTRHSQTEGSRPDATYDDVRVYNKTLTSSEITDIYTATEP